MWSQEVIAMLGCRFRYSGFHSRDPINSRELLVGRQPHIPSAFSTDAAVMRKSEIAEKVHLMKMPWSYLTSKANKKRHFLFIIYVCTLWQCVWCFFPPGSFNPPNLAQSFRLFWQCVLLFSDWLYGLFMHPTTQLLCCVFNKNQHLHVYSVYCWHWIE